MHTLTKEAQQMITLYERDYTINNMTSGVALLKVIVRQAHVDTNATKRYLREQLSSLDKYMIEVGSDIQKFNLHVLSLLEQLYARGGMTEDLLTNLLKGYEAASDKEFVKYIKNKEDEYDDGAEITENQLMESALNKFKIRQAKHIWNAPMEEEEKIIALEAKIEKMQKANKGKTASSKTGENKHRNKRDKDEKSKGKYTKPEWKLIPPKPGESTKKTVKGKDYWWCPNHKAWCRHTKDQCQGKNVPKETNEGAKDGSDDKGKDNPRMQLSQALANLAEAESDDEE
jgi:hypothetical protein